MSTGPERIVRRGFIKSWPAQWIQHIDGSNRENGIFYFRKTVNLLAKPKQFIIHLSADNRYKLYVNGISVSSGPVRSDLHHWRYETINIAPQLRAGKNVLAAVIWNFGQLRPVSQITHETAFILSGDSPTEDNINTSQINNWKSHRSEAYAPIQFIGEFGQRKYYIVCPGEDVDGAKYDWGWNQIDFDDSVWSVVRDLGNGRPRGQFGTTVWQLIPSPIPPLMEEYRRFSRIRWQNYNYFSNAFLQSSSPVTIPPNLKVSVLIDNDVLTTSYPELLVSGGKGSILSIRYGESLFDQNQLKGNRNDIEGKTIEGNQDIFRPDGGENRNQVLLKGLPNIS